VRAIAVTTGLPGESVNDAQFFDSTTSWTYNLCGFGQNCAISQGKDSTERNELLRREALELALYTFKYDHDLQSLVTFMPPALGAPQKGVLFFRRQDLSVPLEHPLAATLPAPKTTLKPGEMDARDLARVRQYAGRPLYSFQYQPL